MDKKEGMNRWKSALLLGGGLAAALLWGCFNPIHAGITDGTDPGSENQGSENPGAGLNPGDGAAGEFTVVLRVGEGPEVPESRNVVGPGAEDIPYSGVCNTIQVIAVDAETQKVVDNKQTSRETENDSKTIWVNIAQGKRYHFLVLMGHRERNYEAEKTSGGKYVYKNLTDLPTLLAAGFLGDQAIHGQPTLSITMKPLVVDTVFEHGDRVTQAVLPKTALPAEVAARIVWTVSGGFATLVEAQTRAGLPGGLNWGGLTLAGKTFIRNGADLLDPTPVLGGAERNQIVLDLGPPTKGLSGSANFKLTYNPLGEQETWIIRNGVNDDAQDVNTTFTLENEKIPWGKTKNGNGAVAFSFEDDEITNIDLTKLVPVPVTAAKPNPEKDFDEGRYTGTVTWSGAGGKTVEYFEKETVYAVTVTLKAGPGFQFSTGGVTVTHGGSSAILDVSETDTEVVKAVFFPATGVLWEQHGGYFLGSDKVEMDSAIDIMKLVANLDSLSLKLIPVEEPVELGAPGTDIGGGLKLTHEGKDTDTSPAKVTIDGGGKRIPLTGAGQGSVITVGNGVTLTLRSITFEGLTNYNKNGATTDNNAPLIKVEDGGALILEDGAFITGNTNASGDGGGVYVNTYGKLSLEGDAYITDNNASGKGGGVFLNGILANKSGGTFTMSGGTISRNTTSGNNNSGGGVFLNVYSTFTMSGGTISRNTTSGNNSGGGVYIGGYGTFTMNGGTISGNTTATNGGNAGGGGVFMGSNGVFTKKPAGDSTESGIIYGNEDTLIETDKNKTNTDRGYAVLVAGGKKRNTTAGPEDVVDPAKGIVGLSSNGYEPWDAE